MIGPWGRSAARDGVAAEFTRLSRAGATAELDQAPIAPARGDAVGSVVNEGGGSRRVDRQGAGAGSSPASARAIVSRGGTQMAATTTAEAKQIEATTRAGAEALLLSELRGAGLTTSRAVSLVTGLREAYEAYHRTKDAGDGAGWTTPEQAFWLGVHETVGRIAQGSTVALYETRLLEERQAKA